MNRFIILLALALAFGCASTDDQCIPKIITQKVLVPVTANRVPPAVLPDLSLFPLPLYPGKNATIEEKKAWAVAVAEAVLLRESQLLSRIDALNIQLDALR